MIEQAIEYGIGILGLQDADIDIYYDADLELLGEIHIDDEGIDIAINNRQRVKDMIITIFHELVHARQWLDGDKAMDENEAYKKEMILYHDFLLTLPVK